jgi:16S rRNA (cytosine967-C5)-methyltransferase
MTQSGKQRELILELWTRTRIDWGFATDRIAETFRREKGLASRERRAVAETLYGMIRQARRVDFALEALSPAPSGPARDVARYVAYRLLEGEIDVATAEKEMRGDWKAVAAVGERIAREKDPVRRLGLARSLPDWLARRLLEQYGEEADTLAESLNRRAPLTVRANTLKIERDALIARLAADGVEAHATRYATAGVVVDTRTNVFGLAAFKEGLFEVQDEASQLVAELVAPPPKGMVIDACAGAGGKTLALGALLQNRGRIVALDVEPRKLEELRRRARRAGLSNARAIEIDDQAYPDEVQALRDKAERVLVDAPCSGLGALRRNPEARWRLTEDDLERLPREQEAIARRAMALVAPGGRLIYATCTILREENEDVVARLVPPGWEIMRAAEIWGTERASWVSDASGTFLRMTPHRHDTDGFFAAVIRRAARP